MLMLQALRNRPIALLWTGQALSAIGDEIYRVALIWLAVTLIGADTGYLAAGQCAALLALSLFGGKWSDQWDHIKTLIWVDGLRCLIVLVPVVLYHFMPLSLSVLWGVALSVSALSAFFDPALQAALPRYSPDLKTLQAATGLMGTTLRLARVLGPAIIGLLTPLMATIHFFSLDAASFAISALSILFLKRFHQRSLRAVQMPKRMSFRESLAAGFVAIRTDKMMRYTILAKGVGAGTWNLAYGLGIALLAHQIAPHDVRAFGWIISAYGVGNLIAALVLGNANRPRPARIMFTGYCWMGLGFVGIAFAPSLALVMLAAAFTAMGGLANDLPFFDLVQVKFKIEELPRIVRLKMVVETASTLVCMLFAPALFKILSVQTVIAICGAFSGLIGVYGWFKYAEPT